MQFFYWWKWVLNNSHPCNTQVNCLQHILFSIWPLFFTALCCQPYTHSDRLDLEDVHHLDVHDFSGEFCSTTYAEITSPTVPAEAWQKLACVFTTCSPSSDCTTCTTLMTNWTPSLSHKLCCSLIQLLTLIFFFHKFKIFSIQISPVEDLIIH